MFMKMESNNNQFKKTYIEQLIRHYELYQKEGIHHINNILASLNKIDPKFADTWADIIQYWDYINNEIDVIDIKNDNKLPKCLSNIKNDNTIAISILGIKLNDDGSMSDELILRLESGLLLANIFQNAYIIVTGGPTALLNKDVTEGGCMADWLINKGIDKKRIIVEDKAMDTVGNAVYTYQILREKYSQIDSIILVSSDYHVARGSLLYYSTLLLESLKTKDQQLKIIANIGCNTNNPGYETIYLQAWSLCQVADIDYWRLNINYE